MTSRDNLNREHRQPTSASLPEHREQAPGKLPGADRPQPAPVVDGWAAVYTNAQDEKLAAKCIERSGFDVYFPEFLKQVKLGRSTIRAKRPLFVRYVFVQLDLRVDPWLGILKTLGVRDFVWSAGSRDLASRRPALLPRSFVDSLVAAQTENFGFAIAPKAAAAVKPGDAVKITTGPFAGFVGVLSKIDESRRATLLLDLFGRATSTTVPDGGFEAA